MHGAAAFAGLVQDPRGQPVDVRRVGTSEFYVVREDDFDWHIEASRVDAAVWQYMKEQFSRLKGDVLPQALDAMGKGDPFTLAAIEAAIDNMDKVGPMQLPPEQKDMLALVGFHIVIDYHGDVLEVAMPEQGIDPDADDLY